MRVAVPFAGVDRRTAFFRATLLSACFLGLIASAPAWLNSRSFPLAPIVSWFPILPAPWDRLFFGAMLLALIAAAWRYRPGVTIFLALGLFAFCEDQNRGQPWFYMYWVLLLLSLFPAPTWLAACRLAVSAIYFWCGAQKFNPGFSGVPAWFVGPASNWGAPNVVVDALCLAAASAPFLEVAIAVGLWIPWFRRAGIGAVIAVHVFALLFLGPLGHNFNWVVWPWNAAMIVLVFGLFAADAFWERNAPAKSPADERSRRSGGRPISPANSGISVGSAFAALRRSTAALIVVILFSLLPLLSFGGWWDSYFSFCLYSGNTANANIFVTQSLVDRLPAHLRQYVRAFQPGYDPRHQGPYVFLFTAWAYEELHVPVIPEPRGYRSIFRALQKYAGDPADVRILIAPRVGKVIFCEGTRVELLEPGPRTHP